MADQDFFMLPEQPVHDPTLLLVESPGQESERYRTLARRAGFRIVTSSSGPMTRALSRRSRPDLVLLSPFTGPPGPSEVARSIKEDPKTSDIPVMIVVKRDPSDPTLSRIYPTEACATDEESDEILIGTLRALRTHCPRSPAVPEPEPSSPLEGDLADDTFPGVLEFLFTTRRTGRIVVMNGSKWPGRIYIDEGNVVHAELAEQRGVEAFRRLCFLTRGRFKFEPEFRAPEQTMTENGMEVLLESARRRDESARVNP